MRRLGANMRRCREERGLTQKQLASRAGISDSTISTIENGRSSSTLFTVCALADALGISVPEYIGLDNKPVKEAKK
jgi:transcriptional regulator with XRE-family HTH domain